MRRQESVKSPGGAVDHACVPTLAWNARWKEDLARWQGEGRAAPFGDQWGDPEQVAWLAAVRERFVTPFVRADRTALEIGSGGGRWTQYLFGFGRLYCVDLHAEMFHYLLQRFGARPNVSFCQTSGTDLPGIPNGSVDYVFTFGTFVHLDPPLIEGYLASLRAVLAPAADVVLQYADERKPAAAANQGFARTSAPLMRALLARHGYAVLDEDEHTLPHSNVLRARPSGG